MVDTGALQSRVALRIQHCGSSHVNGTFQPSDTPEPCYVSNTGCVISRTERFLLAVNPHSSSSGRGKKSSSVSVNARRSTGDVCKIILNNDENEQIKNLTIDDQNENVNFSNGAFDDLTSLSQESDGADEEVLTFINRPIYDWHIFNPVLSCIYYCCSTSKKSPLPPSVGWRQVEQGKLPPPTIDVVEYLDPVEAAAAIAAGSPNKVCVSVCTYVCVCVRMCVCVCVCVCECAYECLFVSLFVVDQCARAAES